MKHRYLLSLSSDDTFLREAYRLLLGRAPDEDGLRFYGERLAAGKMAREEVLAILQDTHEAPVSHTSPRLMTRLHRLVTRRTPGVDSYEYQLHDTALSFEAGTEELEKNLANRITLGHVKNTSANVVDIVAQDLNTAGVSLADLKIDVKEYHKYMQDAQYTSRYPHYYRDNLAEKSLEHYIGLQLLNPAKNGRFVDIASEHSPVPEIYARLTGCESYAQDMMFKTNLKKNRIGGDAGNMPVPDGFFQSALVSCSIEHFEGDADGRLMKEMQRTLAPGGSAVIVPLYMYTQPAIQTDPTYSVPGNVSFDEDAEIFCARGWGNRHGRFYSAASLQRRVLAHCPGLDITLYRILGYEQVDGSVYCRFALRAMKPAA